MRIKVCEIKEGDIFQVGNSTHYAHSDSYLNNVWEVNIGNGYTYGFTNNGEHTVIVKR